jgi:NTP pyrophosphatase (non-canonical NTP hydrolase)
MSNSNPDSVKDLIRAAVAFRDERDWAQFHSPKELAISLAVESAELIQLMQWFKGEELDRVICDKHDHLKDELADVLFSVLLLADELKIELGKAFLDKLEKTGSKYPVDKSKGSAKKYTEL